METKQAFKALSKICLNNWHYIDRKVLTLNQGINSLPDIPEVESLQ